MNGKRTHVVIPEQLVKDIDALVGRRQRYRQLAAIDAAAGAWKDQNHPELKQGAAKYISRLRRQDEKRFQKVTAR
jgi:Arc/MetJ-type ribon-helix-helix transcriptional regulator